MFHHLSPLIVNYVKRYRVKREIQQKNHVLEDVINQEKCRRVGILLKREERAD